MGLTPPLVRLRGDDSGGQRLWMWCPACEDLHCVGVGLPGSWTWSGDEGSPTIAPSILVGGVQWEPSQGFHKPHHHVPPGAPIVCHSYVRAGRWEYLPDCTHDMAGQTVPMVSLPDWATDDYLGGTTS